MCRIALRAIVTKMLIKSKRNLREFFYQVVAALGYHAQPAGLSCLQGWPLQTRDDVPGWTWKDVAIGIGIKEGRVKQIIREIHDAADGLSIAPLKRDENGNWL